MKNAFVDAASGQVQGIDNDMAFGKGEGAEKPLGLDGAGRRGWTAKNLPKFVDSGLATQLTLVTATQVEEALKGLLPSAEIEATVGRLRHIKAYISQMSDGQKLADDQWDARTAFAQNDDAMHSYLASASEARANEMGLGNFDLSGTLKDVGETRDMAKKVGKHAKMRWLITMGRKLIQDVSHVTDQVLEDGALAQMEAASKAKRRAIVDEKNSAGTSPERQQELGAMVPLINKALETDLAAAIGTRMTAYAGRHGLLKGAPHAELHNVLMTAIKVGTPPGDAELMSANEAAAGLLTDQAINNPGFSTDDADSVMATIISVVKRDLRWKSIRDPNMIAMDAGGTEEDIWQRRGDLLQNAQILVQIRSGQSV
ncbi:MAG: hypothetical protein ACI9MR_002029 [Myxococcota bacterium]|jgi:hypothetical protein